MCERQDIEARRAQDLKRWHRRVAERRASGTCIRCGKRPPQPDRSDCDPCAEKRRKADLERHHKRTAERTALGLCPRCGLCRTPHKPHDVEFVVMLSKVEVSMYSKGLTANPFT